jgi:hypothetical protein
MSIICNSIIFTNSKINPGTVVVFDEKCVNPFVWKKMSEEDRIKNYGFLGYRSDKIKRFVFLCEIKNAPGHCVLIDLETQQILTMVHTNLLREVTIEEF